MTRIDELDFLTVLRYLRGIKDLYTQKAYKWILYRY